MLVKIDENWTNSEKSRNLGASNVTKADKEKTIQVQQVEVHQGKDDSENGRWEGRTIPIKQMEETMTEADKESKTNVKREFMSPRKTSKLPPVCLGDEEDQRQWKFKVPKSSCIKRTFPNGRWCNVEKFFIEHK